MKITRFDRPVVKDMRNEINSALAKITKKYGVTFSIGTIRFTEGEIRTKLTGSIPSIKQKEVKKKKDNAGKEWELFAPFLGFRGDEYGKVFVDGKKSYKITGINMKAKRYPVKVTDISNGKSYRAPVNTVLLGLYGTTVPQNKRSK